MNMTKSILFLMTCAVLAGSQTLNVTRTVINPITNFNISYVDLTGGGTGPTLFTISLTPGAPSAQKYQIVFSVNCTTSVVRGLLYKARTRPFTFNLPRTMTSNQFMADNNADSMTLHSNDVKLSDKSLQENLLVSGVMPSGRITLRFELVRDGSNTPVDVPKIVILDIISIRILKPISPGIAASRMQDFTPSIFTPYPQFIWASDLMPVVYPQEIIKFTVSVYDNPGQRNVPAEILRSAPLWSIDINGGREINYAQYPMTSAPQLKPDHVYYWQVVAHLLGPENRELAGELFSFTIADLDFGINLTPTQNDILNCLQIILGPNYGYILQDLKEMTPDESINLNGQTINITTLKAIAERFARNELIVRDVSLENK